MVIEREFADGCGFPSAVKISNKRCNCRTRQISAPKRKCPPFETILNYFHSVPLLAPYSPKIHRGPNPLLQVPTIYKLLKLEMKTLKAIKIPNWVVPKNRSIS